MSSHKPSLLTQDEVTETDALGLFDGVSVTNDIFFGGAVTMPPAIQDALTQKTLPTQQPRGTNEPRNTLLAREKHASKVRTDRTMKQMGGQRGFRGNDKKKH